MAKPTREFSGKVGQKSMGTAGPEYIKKDLDKAFAMFDPNKTLPDGSPGGISEENLAQGAVGDFALGDREVDDNLEAEGNIGGIGTILSWLANMVKSITGKNSWATKPDKTMQELSNEVFRNVQVDDTAVPSVDEGLLDTVLSWIANMVKGITGKSSWRTKPACTLEEVADSKLSGIKMVGSIDLVEGTGVQITTNAGTKKITIAAKNDSIVPGPHMTTHVTGGSDEIAPEDIGAETLAGSQAKVNTHENKSAPHSGHETPAGSQSKVDKLKGQIESGAVVAKNAENAENAINSRYLDGVKMDSTISIEENEQYHINKGGGYKIIVSYEEGGNGNYGEYTVKAQHIGDNQTVGTYRKTEKISNDKIETTVMYFLPSESFRFKMTYTEQPPALKSIKLVCVDARLATEDSERHMKNGEIIWGDA